jgi:hypothetical protein
MSLSKALKSARSLRAVEDLFCQQIAPILMPLGDPSAMLEPIAPTSEPKMAARAAIVPGLMDRFRTGVISYSESSEQKPREDR